MIEKSGLPIVGVLPLLAAAQSLRNGQLEFLLEQAADAVDARYSRGRALPA